MQSEVEVTQHYRNRTLLSIKSYHSISGVAVLGLRIHKMMLAKIKGTIPIVLNFMSLKTTFPMVSTQCMSKPGK